MNADPVVALKVLIRALSVTEGPFGITLKLADPLGAKKYLKIFRDELAKIGIKDVTSRHLWHNRSELCIMGTTAKPKKR